MHPIPKWVNVRGVARASFERYRSNQRKGGVKVSHERNWKYKRRMLRGKKIAKMMEFLKENLSSEFFFNKTKWLAIKVRAFEFEGVSVAIKNTRGEEAGGSKPEEFRETFLTYHRETKRGKLLDGEGKPIREQRARVISPKIYGKIGNYIIMECMDGMAIRDSLKVLRGDTYYSLKEAYKELEKNVRVIKENKKFKKDRDPQPFHAIVLGNTNPKNPWRGQWLFSLPYDSK